MSATSTTDVERALAIAAAHPAFDGHFPGRPVLPGVALLAEVLEAAHEEPRLAACIGTAPRLAVVKFLAPVEPGASLVISFRLGPSRRRVESAGRRARGRDRPDRARRPRGRRHRGRDAAAST